MTPEMEEGIAIARKENPAIGNVQTYGPLSRFLMSDANAYTSPGRNIYLNPATMTGFNPQEVADTITHEQTHVNQMKERGYGPTREFFQYMFGGSGEPYGRRPDEIEAFQAEERRRARMGRMPGVMPSFDNAGEYYIPMGDIMLPQEKGVKVGPSSGALGKLQGKNARK